MGNELKIDAGLSVEISELASKLGKPVEDVIQEALADYRQARDPAEILKRWRAALELDWANRNGSDFKIEDLYDPETGFPA